MTASLINYNYYACDDKVGRALLLHDSTKDLALSVEFSALLRTLGFVVVLGMKFRFAFPCVVGTLIFSSPTNCTKVSSGLSLSFQVTLLNLESLNRPIPSSAFTINVATFLSKFLNLSLTDLYPPPVNLREAVKKMVFF